MGEGGETDNEGGALTVLKPTMQHKDNTCITELCTGNLCNFIDQCHPNKLNEKSINQKLALYNSQQNRQPNF